MNKKAFVSLFAVILLTITFPVCSESEGSDVIDGDETELGGNCTGFYVGKRVSADGTTLIGQTDDSNFANVSYHTYPELTEKGRKIKGNEGFEYDLPEHTYRYTVFGSNRDNGVNHSGTGGINSQGLAYTGSITAMPNSNAEKADPFVKGGINEDCIGVLLCMCCDTARSAVNMLCKIMAEKGSSEGAIFLLADQNEAWYFEVYTGHQYLAIRLPEDKMSTFGNEFNIIHVSEGLEYIASPDLKSLADNNGFAVYDEEKEHTIENLRIKDTYAEENSMGCHLRTWRGHNLFDKIDYGDYSKSTNYPLLFSPKEKITVKNMMDYLRDRCEGTPYCPETTGGKWRVVGIEFTLEAHVLQIHDDLPKEMCVTYWGCIAPPEFGVYLPFNNLVSEFHESFGVMGKSTIADPDTMYGIIKQINGVCYRVKDSMKDGVRKYWDDLENYYLTIYSKVLENTSRLLSESKDKAEEYITDYTIGIQESAFDDAYLIRDHCVHFLSVYINTLRDLPKMPAVVDVIKYSERYGWTSEIVDGIVTLRHDNDVMVIEDTSTAQKSKCTVTFNGKVYDDVFLYKWGDVLCLDMDAVAETLSSYEPVIVIKEKGSDNNDDTTVFVIAILAMLLAVIGIVIFARKT